MTAPTITPPGKEATPSEEVVAGADTHADTIHVAVITVLGQDVADQEFPTTPGGYRRAVDFVHRHGTARRFGIEGTSSYGAGLARAARAGGLTVLEVNRPDRSERRRRGKSDPIDAYLAAQAVLSGRATTAPKSEQIEGLRALHTTRRSAVKARAATLTHIKQRLVSADDPVREKYRQLSDHKLIQALALCRPAASTSTSNRAVLSALKTLAQRHRYLSTEIRNLTDQIRALTTQANPGLLAAHGIGPDTAAQLLITAGGNPERLTTPNSFAALCGTAPVPASSGRVVRHRLSRGGDRAANNALHRIALVRMSTDPRTRAYVSRQRARGRSSPEILRQLKRAIAREVFKYLTRAITPPQIADLRPARQAKNITLTQAAQHFDVWPMHISSIERGTRRDDDLANAYRQWLTAA